ncbi:DUF2913 family protein [Vibrio chagasii]|uniref:DUF2913 family protein n=1 Tax=Vibrio chagasii TaxID=170679 RepID=UPI0022850CC8|nr:DUF2913 family protein [Vibrio chagasii]MCY9828819.1 DUF2913 family protein [Vibrio chagasii]
MSKNLKHYQATTRLVTHALFALYFHIQGNKGYTPIKRRNEILVKFIKGQQKKAVYSTLKKEIKTMLAIGRNPKGNLEARLHEINRLNLEYKAKLTDADTLYVLFNHLYEALNLASQLTQPETNIEEDILYMNQSDIEDGFDEQNNQIKPLGITVKTQRLEALIHHINSQDTYTIEVVGAENDVISLLLHKKAKTEGQSKAS